jgi:hypothetical protein
VDIFTTRWRSGLGGVESLTRMMSFMSIDRGKRIWALRCLCLLFNVFLSVSCYAAPSPVQTYLTHVAIEMHNDSEKPDTIHRNMIHSGLPLATFLVTKYCDFP